MPIRGPSGDAEQAVGWRSLTGLGITFEEEFPRLYGRCEEAFR